jgi:hypothetical protein
MNLIGRSQSTDVTFRIVHSSVNRFHARIWYKDGEWLLEDLQSRIGTEVNGQRIPSQIAQATVRLNDRDRIRLGVHELWFRLQLPGRDWLMPAVRGLARCISADGEIHLLPILADALEETGCDDEMILQHCRLPRPGWRISWVAEFLCALQVCAEPGPEGVQFREFIEDLTSASTFEEFVAAFNDGFCRHCAGHWHGRSWNAFHDYLSWPEDKRFRLVLKGWDRCGGLSGEDRKLVREILADDDHVEAVFA